MNSGSSAQNDPLTGFAAIMQAQAAQAQVALGKEWLQFSREQFDIGNKRQDKIDALTEQVTQRQLTSMDNFNTWSAEDRARYKDVFLPLQDKFIEKANNWDSAEKQAIAAAEAKADVTNAYAEQQAQRERAMAAQGIRPDSGAWAGTSRAADLGAALAGAGAQNMARKQLRNEATALQGEAINMGNGLPGQASQALGMGVNTGNSTVGNNIANQNSWRSNIGIMNTGYEGAMTGWNNSANIWRNIGKDRTDMLNYSDKLRAESMGGLLGGLGKLAGSFISMSSKDVKNQKGEAKGVLDMVKNMDVDRWEYKPGVSDEREHIGPYAEDFARETGLGDGKTINMVDAIGVTMGAVKELAEKVDKLDGRRPKGKSIMREAA